MRKMIGFSPRFSVKVLFIRKRVFLVKTLRLSCKKVLCKDEKRYEFFLMILASLYDIGLYAVKELYNIK